MTPLPNDFRRLSIQERIALAQALWDSIADESHPPLLSDAQRRELERRAAEDAAAPGEVGGADDVDAGEGQQQDVGRLRQSAGDVAFQGLDFLGFSLAIVVEGQGDAEVLVGGDVAGRGLVGPVEDGLDGALLEADAGLAEGVT